MMACVIAIITVVYIIYYRRDGSLETLRSPEELIRFLLLKPIIR
jgi:hypothetical protein